ncbi:MAG TPA: (Fe-S)-binding protein [Casimicrobiaceae bacterium]|nr:(Fe-S)-binding protein [Casimicrobiaceae bacterium]
MNDTVQTLDACGTRLTVEKPAIRYDRQGDRSDAERIAAAMTAFGKDFGRTAALYLESCIHCGNCAQACHFYLATRDPKYTPIWKLEPFKQAYKREAGPFAWLYRTFDLKPAVSVDQLQAWQELLYDACTMCGRCTMACPMGIDIASLVGLARHAMFEAGLVPHELWAVAERAAREGSPLGATAKVLRERIDWLADDYDVEMHLDEPAAEVLVTFSSIEIMKYPESLVATARLLNHAGYAWTVCSAGYEATNFGMMSGNLAWQRQATLKLIEAAIACNAKVLVLPECGHAYMALRWQGANLLGRPLPFRVLHISEFVAENIANGRIRLRKVDASVAFHDPCQVSRRGGATSAPRAVLAALGVDLRETQDSGALNFCCGGGGGVIANRRADELRYGAFRIKMQQIDATGAEMALTSCANCRQSFDDGGAHFHWDRSMGSLLELCAERLEERVAAAGKQGLTADA